MHQISEQISKKSRLVWVAVAVPFCPGLETPLTMRISIRTGGASWVNFN